MSYTAPAVADTNLTFGMQLHHPRFLELIGAPESARLLYHSPAFWIQRLGEEDALAATVGLQRDRTFRLVYSDSNNIVIHISLRLHFRTYVSFIISGYSYYVNMLVTRLKSDMCRVFLFAQLIHSRFNSYIVIFIWSSIVLLCT